MEHATVVMLSKMGAATVLLASVYWLVIKDKVTSDKYIILVISALAALGITVVPA